MRVAVVTMEMHANWPRRAVVFGATGGIGAALCRQLEALDQLERLYVGGRREFLASTAKAVPFVFDLSDDASLESAARSIACEGEVDLVIVATGLLSPSSGAGPEKSWKALNRQDLNEVLAMNLVGPAMIARFFLPLLPRERRSVFAALSARVGSIGDNRLGGWHSYRASKAALNMLVKTLAIELSRTHAHAIVAGLHPGTVDTALSEPFQRNVPDGRLFTPEHSAANLVRVIQALEPQQSGGFYAWDGSAIPF